MINYDRWIFLVCCSIAHLAGRIPVDQTAALVGRLSSTVSDCLDGTDNSCLTLNSAEYNSLFVAHAWSACLGAVFTGFLIRKYGIWIVSYVTAVFLLIGSMFFALGPYLNYDKSASYGLMLTGRIIFGFPMFADVVLSLQVLSHWFFHKEVALAFTVYFTLGRLGSVIATLAGGALSEIYGLQTTLWITFSIGLLSPALTIVAGYLYKKYAARQEEVTIVYEKASANSFDFRKMSQLSTDFWIICAVVLFYYAVSLTVLSDYMKYLIEAYGYSESYASTIGGLIVILALLAPAFGWLVDRVGHRSTLTLLSTLTIFLATLCQSLIRNIEPAITASLVGITYAICSASIWSSIAVLEEPRLVGIAMGLSTGIQQFGIGLMILVSGFLLNAVSTNRWMYFFALQAGVSGLALLLAIWSMYRDWRYYRSRLRMPLRAAGKVAAMRPTESAALLATDRDDVASIGFLPPE